MVHTLPDGIFVLLEPGEQHGTTLAAPTALSIVKCACVRCAVYSTAFATSTALLMMMLLTIISGDDDDDNDDDDDDDDNDDDDEDDDNEDDENGDDDPLTSSPRDAWSTTAEAMHTPIAPCARLLSGR